MMVVAVAAGVGLAVVISFAAGAFLGLYAAGKIPDKNGAVVVEDKEEPDKKDSKMPLPQQFENLMNYDGGLTDAE